MKILHTMLRVKNLEVTLQFYTGFIGLKEVGRKPLGDAVTLAFLADDSGGHQIELTLNHGKTDYELGDQFGHLAFGTSDLDDVIRDVQDRGWWYRESKPESPSRYIFVKDPNGYDIEILERQ